VRCRGWSGLLLVVAFVRHTWAHPAPLVRVRLLATDPIRWAAPLLPLLQQVTTAVDSATIAATFTTLALRTHRPRPDAPGEARMTITTRTASLTISQVAEAAQVAPSTVRFYAEHGIVRATRTG
jgi:hypothetical protein